MNRISTGELIAIWIGLIIMIGAFSGYDNSNTDATTTVNASSKLRP